MCAENISPSFLSPILLLLLRNVGLMSVRVRYRLTNYHCHSSLHPPPTPPTPSLSRSLLQPCHLQRSLFSTSRLSFLLSLSFSPLLCLLYPTVASTRYDTTRAQRANREDQSQNTKSTKIRRETLTLYHLPLSLSLSVCCSMCL